MRVSPALGTPFRVSAAPTNPSCLSLPGRTRKGGSVAVGPILNGFFQGFDGGFVLVAERGRSLVHLVR